MDKLIAVLRHPRALGIQFALVVADLSDNVVARLHAEFVMMPGFDGLFQSQRDQNSGDDHREVNKEVPDRFNRLRRRMNFHDWFD